MPDLSLRIPAPPTTEEKHHFESASQFVHQMATEIKLWLLQMKSSDAANGKQWMLSATLSNGTVIDVHRLGAHGHSMIRIEGKLSNGSPCLFVAHQHSVQLLVYYVPCKPEEPKRELGFHTGIGKDITIEQ